MSNVAQRTMHPKQLVRDRMLALYRAHDMTHYIEHAVRLVEQVACFTDAHSVLAYRPIRTIEIPLIHKLKLRHQEKKWFIPQCIDQDTMQFVSDDTCIESLVASAYNSGDLLADRICCIVPSVALDVQGNRLGKGKGYYDRFLYKHARIADVSISVVPEFAFIDGILEHEAHDIRVAYPLCALASMEI